MAEPRARSWAEVRLDVPAGWEELVAEELERVLGVPAAVGRVDPARPATPPGTSPVQAWIARPGDPAALLARLGDALRDLGARAGAPELAGLRPELAPRADEDWGTLWRRSWRPFRVGRLCVVGRGPRPPARPGDLHLSLEPGGVFGTGRHATTRACLRLLQARLVPGARVLDVGTGTGILSVAAALLGAATALGFDVDPGSEPAARELALENGVAGRCTFRTGSLDVLGPDDGPFDAVLANVYADVLREAAPRLAGLLRPGGWLCASGIERRHRPAVLASFEEEGLRLEHEEERRRWCTLLAVREAAGRG